MSVKPKSKTAHIPLYGSKFFIVINTNQVHHVELFTSMMKNLTLSRNILNFFLWKETKEDQWIKNPPIAQIISSMDDLSVTSGIEIGPRNHFVHANLTLATTHYHYLSFDIEKLRSWIVMKSGGLFIPNIKIEKRMMWPTDRKYTIKDYGYIPEFSIHNKFYDVDGKSSVFNDEVQK